MVNTILKVLFAVVLFVIFQQNAKASIKPFTKPVPTLNDTNVVNVYNWQGYIDPKTIELFEQETGITVNYQTFDNVKTFENKLAQNESEFDVVVPEIAFTDSQSRNGRLLKLEQTQIPNMENLDSRLVKMAKTAGYPEGYSAYYLWGTVGIGYSLEKVSAILGNDNDMNSWAAIFDVDNISRLSKCGVWLLDAPNDIYPIILNYLGADPNNLSAENLEKANNVLLKIKPYIKNFNSSSYYKALADGSACVTVGWSGDVFLGIEMSKDAGANNTIKYIIPKQGTLAWMDVLSIPTQAKNIENAYKFINFMLRPDIAGANAMYVSYASSNDPKMTLVDASYLEKKEIYPDEDVMRRLFFRKTLTSEDEARIKQFWSEVVDK
jgi:putrescine transport system substrate-binding protein